MVIDHAIRCINVMVSPGRVSSRYGVFENGDLIGCVSEYSTAEMIVAARKEPWADHGE